MDAAQSDRFAAAIAVANSWWTRPKLRGGLALLDALQRFGGPRPQALRLPPLIARVNRHGVASINGLPRSPSAAPERVRGDALFDAVAASARGWTSNGTGR